MKEVKRTAEATESKITAKDIERIIPELSLDDLELVNQAIAKDLMHRRQKRR